MISLPRSSRCSTCCRVSGVHARCSCSSARCSASRSRIRVRRSSAIGCSSGVTISPDGRSSISPRSIPRRPPIQPRQLELRDRYRDERNGQSQSDEEQIEILSRLGAPARHEAEIMHQDQALGIGLCTSGPADRHQQRTSGGAHQPPGTRGVGRVGTPDVRRHRRRRDRHSIRCRAIGDGEQPLVLRQVFEVCPHLDRAAVVEQRMQPVLRRVRDQGGAQIEVSLEPPHRQLVDQRPHRIRDDGESDQQWNDEAERKSHLRWTAKCGRGKRGAAGGMTPKSGRAAGPGAGALHY